MDIYLLGPPPFHNQNRMVVQNSKSNSQKNIKNLKKKSNQAKKKKKFTETQTKTCKQKPKKLDTKKLI